MATEAEVRGALAQVQDPELGRSIVDLGMVRDLKVEDGKVVFTLALTTLSCPLKDRIVSSAKQAVQAVKSMASQLEMRFLVCLPIDSNIAELCDRGEIESYPGDLFEPIAKKISELTPVAVLPKTKKHEPQGA